MSNRASEKNIQEGILFRQIPPFGFGRNSQGMLQSRRAAKRREGEETNPVFLLLPSMPSWMFFPEARRRAHPGFTLIEMLIALTIIASILAMVHASYAATTRAIDASRTRMACLERGSFALRLMARQIRCAYAPSGDSNASKPDAIGSTRIAASDEKAPALFQGNSRNPGGEILSFVTSSDAGAAPGANGLTRVTYRYDRAAMTLSVDRCNGENRRRTGDFVTILRNVTSVELKFHDGRQWQDMWDSHVRQGLPRAVKVDLVVLDESGRSHCLGTALPVVQRTGTESKNTRRVAAGQP